MRNAIGAELMKARKNKIFLICSLIVLLSAVLIVAKDLFFVDAPTDYQDWLNGNYMVTGLVLPIMSGFIITFLIQREYEDKTIINVLTAPTSRLVFLLSKLTVWFLWYAIVLLAIEVVYLIGGVLLYPRVFTAQGISQFVITQTEYSLLSFVAFLPLLWIAVLQKRMFYPTVMAALLFVGIELAAINMPIQVAAALPWSAPPLLSLFEAPSGYVTIGFISIFLAGLLGVVLACVTFARQDQ